MASEKQIKANRENAKRSTGPRSAAGKLASSRNATSHGLSISLAADSAASTKAYKLAETLTLARADQAQKMEALEMAQAQIQLIRVAAVRSSLIASLDLTSRLDQQVRRLAALDRYERPALKQRLRAARRLWGTEPVANDHKRKN